MKNLRKEIRQNSSIHKKIRKASFVPIESQKNKRFKYFFDYYILSKIRKLKLSIRQNLNKVTQKIALWLSKFDWKKVKDDLFGWSVKVFIEGFTANVATHYLFGVKFSFMMIIAHGILINQTIDIWWRLKTNNGSNSKLPEKDESADG